MPKPHRQLEAPGRFDRPPDATVQFDGKAYSARTGEPLAVSLLAHGVRIIGRSGKYHRGRGLFCGAGSCGNCLARVDGVPNQRTCLIDAHAGARVDSQHTLGGARFDLYAALDFLFARGLDHHHLMTGVSVFNRFAVAMARRMGGHGELPDAALPPADPPQMRRTDVAVIGGGAAGRAVAEATRNAGLDTVVVDGRAERGDLGAWIVGLFDDRELVAVSGNQQLRIRARAHVLASGTYEQAPSCPGNDLPGVLALGAAERALAYGVLPGNQVAIVVDGKAGLSTRGRAAALAQRLLALNTALELAAGLGKFPGAQRSVDGALIEIQGSAKVCAVRLAGFAKPVKCDALVWCGRPTPAYELARQVGLDAPLDDRVGGFVPAHRDDGSTERAGWFVAGEVAGVAAEEAGEHGRRVGASVVEALRSARASGVAP